MKNKLILLFSSILCICSLYAQTYTTGVINLTTTSGLAMSVKIDIGTQVTLTLTGPSGRWFAVGFNSNSMAFGTDVVGVHSAGTLNAFDNSLVGYSAPVSDAQQDWTISSDVVNAGVRTIIATRALNTFDANDYTFSPTPTSIGLIWARSSTASFSYSNHGPTNRGTALVSFTYVPPPSPPAAPTGAAFQTFCSGATLAQLSATGSSIQWYATATGGSPLPSNTVLVNGAMYYASQTVNGLESTSRLMVHVIVNTAPSAPNAINGPVHFCYATNGQSYSIAGISGATSYIWTTPAGATGTSSSTSINLILNQSFQSGTLSVKAQNTCGQSAATSIVINQHLSSSTSLNASACESYNFNGQNYTQSGTYTYQGTTIWGCDSTVVLALTIYNATTFTQTVNSCESYSWNGQTYSNSGVYTDTLQTMNGCDSVVVLQLTIHNATNTSLNESACGSYSWNGQSYFNSGLYSDTLQTMNGCDSIVNLNLTIHPITSQIFDTTALDLFAWNGTNYTTSGTYTQFFTSVFGCDSTVTYNVTIQDSGIEELNATNLIYPNPVKGNGSIHIQNISQICPYRIFNSNGALQQNGMIRNGMLEINNLPAGKYTIETNGNRYHFVVE